MARTELEHPRRSPPRIGHDKPDCSREPRLLSTAPMPGVPVTALTYAEAQERARLIDVSGYHVDLDLTGGEEVFGSVTVVRFGWRAPGAGPGRPPGGAGPPTGRGGGAQTPPPGAGRASPPPPAAAEGETYLAVH